MQHIMNCKIHGLCSRKGTQSILLICLLALMPLSLSAKTSIVYSKSDSTAVVKMLKEGAKQPKGTCLTLYYANQLKGLPYVAATLEFNATEQLAINLRQMDCLTLVENVMALSLTTQHGSTSFQDFCQWLERLRYRDGKLDGYASRNHYFTQWCNSNRKLGFITELQGEAKNTYAPFIAQKKIDLHYMSVHPNSYPMLKQDRSQLTLIKQYEKEASGKTIRYIPRSELNKGKDVLGCIHDGDILAIVTKKDGLDVSHLGLAVWDKDGKLHLLNASSIHHKVVLEPMTLYEYMGKHPTQLGIRVIRPTTSSSK